MHTLITTTPNMAICGIYIDTFRSFYLVVLQSNLNPKIYFKFKIYCISLLLYDTKQKYRYRHFQFRVYCIYRYTEYALITHN